MCSPAAFGGAQAGLGMVQSVMQFVGQNAAAKANATDANLNYGNKMTSLNQENVQTSEATSESTLSGAIRMAQGFGRVAASASSLGIGASTLAPWMSGVQGAGARDIAITQKNAAAKRSEIGMEMTGAGEERQSQINQVLPESPLQLGVSLGGAAVSGGSLYGQLGGKFDIAQPSPGQG